MTEETHHCSVWHSNVNLPQVIEGDWEIEDGDPISMALLHRLKGLGVPAVTSYQLAMHVQEGMAILIQERNNNSDNCRK